MNKPGLKTQTGFTLIELMVATTIFSIVLVVLLASFLQVGRIYYKGVSISSTNEAARTLIDDITSDINLTQSAPSVRPNAFCIGQHRYSYKLGQKVTPSDTTADSANFKAGVILDTVGSGFCPDPSTTGANPQQLLGANMQLNELGTDMAPASGPDCNTLKGEVCSISVRVVYYGVDNTVFESASHPGDSGTPAAAKYPDAQCSGSLLSTQFCATADFSTNTLAGGI